MRLPFARPGRRAVYRIAWRDARRHRGRTRLIVAMIALPVAGLTIAAIAMASASVTLEQYRTAAMGAADVGVAVAIHEVDDVLAGLPAGTESTVVIDASSLTLLDGRRVGVHLTGRELLHPVLVGQYRLAEGRPPAAPGEIAVSRPVLEAFGVGIGDTITFDDPPISAEVVGRVVDRADTESPVGVVVPAALGVPEVVDRAVASILIRAGSSTFAEVLAVLEQSGQEHGLRTELFPREEPPIHYLIATAVAALALIETGLIAAAALAVGARRQLRTLGLVGAAGGAPIHVRGVVLATGLVLGVVGSLVGAGVGLVVGSASVPLVGRAVRREIDTLQIPVSMILVAVALGAVASLVAAWVPAWRAGRVSTLDALAGRTRAPAPAGRWAWTGVGIVGVAMVVLAWATVERRTTVFVVAVVALLGGVALAIPLLVGLVGRLVGPAPVPLRIAGRDTARHGRRTGAAVVAAMLALGIPVAASAAMLSQEAWHNAIPAMAPDQFLIEHDAWWERDPEAMAVEVERAITVVRAAVDVIAATPVVYAQPATPRHQFDDSVSVMGPLIWLSETESRTPGARLAIADDELIAALHLDQHRAALRAGAIVVPAPQMGRFDDGTVQMSHTDTREPAVESGVAYRRVDMAVAVVSPERAAELGIASGRLGTVVVRTADPVEGEVVTAARQAIATIPGAYISTAADYVEDSGPWRAVMVAFCAVLGLAIVGAAVALVAVESRRDQAVLVAVGSGPALRRRIVASGAMLLAGIAGVLAVPAGFLPVAVFQVFRPGDYPVVVPWLAIAVVLLAVPLVAGLVTGATSRRPVSTDLLRPVE